MNMIVFFFEEQLVIKKHLHKIILNINVKLAILKSPKGRERAYPGFLAINCFDFLV